MAGEQIVKEGSSGSQNTILVVLLTILGLSVVAVTGIIAFRLGQSRPETVSLIGEPTTTSSPAPQISPSPTLAPASAKPNTSPASESDADKIRQALANKYGKTIGETEISISKNTGTHANGSVRFTGEMGGGMWLAYNNGVNWVITYDGHGTIPCSAVDDPYNFPTDMSPECWDETTDTLIAR